MSIPYAPPEVGFFLLGLAAGVLLPEWFKITKELLNYGKD